MANKLANAQSDSQGNEESLDSLREGTEEFSGEGSYVITGSKSSKRLIRWVSPDQALVLSSHITKDSIFKPIQIPKPLVGLDEKYLRRCLDLIHSRASIMAQKTTGLWPEITSQSSFDSVVFESPVIESGSVVIGLGSIMGSQSMANILKSPLFRAPERIVFKDSATPNPSVSSSPARLEKGDLVVHREVPKQDSSDDRTAHEKRTSSLSSTNSDRAVSTAAIRQAMLQCTWKSGVPHFVLSADDQRDVFSANLSKDEKKGLDYEYSFSREVSSVGSRSRAVCKMTVSTSLTIGADDSKTAETEFVLFSGSESTRTAAEIPTGKHKGFPRRMADVFRPSKSSIQHEDAIDHDHEHDHPWNPELAAIVVKDRIDDDDQTEEDEPKLGGGWGLKFLKKAGVKVKQPTKCDRNNGECSTSMDILIPAGLHGGPGARNAGPSSLTERWRSGGQCDCGGWDLGCPITVLKPKPNKDDETQEEFKSFDFVTQGSGHGSPMLRLVKVRDDLYFVHYRRSLSVLQSFSIAVAAIHSRSPNLRPKGVQGLK